MKDISLGGINEKNFKRLKLISPYGFAGISFFDKKKGPKKGPFKFIQTMIRMRTQY